MPLLASNVCSVSTALCQSDCQPHCGSVIAFANSVPHFRVERLAHHGGSRNCVVGGEVQHTGRTPRASSGRDGSRSSNGLSFDNATKTKIAEISRDLSAGNEPKISSREPVKAAFFDVDGTITRTNVVLAYLSVRMTELSFLKKLIWLPCFALCCLVYLFVDHIHRPTFNRLFYLCYKGRAADSKTAMANLIYERYYKPRIMEGAVEQIQELKQLGYHIVFVTGALDFQIAPLARDLGADFVYAAKLVEKNGRFTGELNGMATSNTEKAERVWDYAKRFGVSLRDSLAFGDSIADIAMLEVVGTPHAVNPDSRLHAIALNRGWAILRWCVKKQKMAVIVPA